MKRFLGSLLFLGVAAVSQAAVVTCSAANNTVLGSSGTTSQSCAAFTVPGGQTVTGVTISYLFDIIVSSTTANASYAFNLPGTAYDFSGSVTAGVRPSFGTVSVASADWASILSGFTAGETWKGSSSVLQTNWQLSYDVTTAPSGVPEPSTFVMIGLALTGVGLRGKLRKRS